LEVITASIPSVDTNPKTLDIDAPSSVESGDIFTVIITDQETGSPIQYASVILAGSGAITTDVNGEATLTASEVTTDLDYTISASADGYNQKTTTIRVINVPVVPMLFISPSTIVVEINTTFQITISSETGLHLTGAKIEFNNNFYTILLDGQVTLSAPLSEGDYLLIASYSGYISASKNVKVIKIEDIKAFADETTVEENTKFSVKVETDDGDPIINAKVYLEEDPSVEAYTDEYGNAWLTAPEGKDSDDGSFNVVVEKGTTFGETVSDSLTFKIGSSAGGSGQSVDGNPSDDNSAPGFEIILLFLSLILVFFIRKKS